MTSNDHHPGWVLIPQRKFDQLRDAEKALSVLPVPEPGYEAEPVAWIRPSDLAELGRITELAQWVFGRPDEMYSQPLYASPVPVAISREEIARTIAESYGVDPDDPAPLAVMCTADNQPVPWWEVYAEQADAILQRLSNQQGGGRIGSIPELPGVSAVQLPASSTAQHSDEGEG